MSDPSEPSETTPKTERSCAKASEASATPRAGSEPQPSAEQASEPSGKKFGGKQGGGIAAAAAALAEEGIKAGHVVTWIGASGNIVRFDRNGRARKFGTIED